MTAAAGTWHIVRTSLPFWRKRAGAITYAPLPGGEVADVVTWRDGQRKGIIVGIDRAINEDGWQWEWRGVQPLTLLVRSRWCFVAVDADASWAVTLFEKTLFTPAGVDIYCRCPAIDETARASALAACAADPRTARYSNSLFAPPPWDGTNPGAPWPDLPCQQRGLFPKQQGGGLSPF